MAGLSVSKGQTAIVQHRIDWNQFQGDTMKVGLTVVDATGMPAGDALVVPAEIIVDFEKHQFRFDYAVKAGSKPGTYKITLKPAAGPTIDVQVKVE